MMLIICDKDPYLAVDFLIKNTNRNFVFKQLLELCQLICSAGISDEYKAIPQGKELQQWIKNNIGWVLKYTDSLFSFCLDNIRLKEITKERIDFIIDCLYDYWITPTYEIDNAIFRYKNGYKSEYKTNTLLPIDEAIKQYKKYILEYKFKKEDKYEKEY